MLFILMIFGACKRERLWAGAGGLDLILFVFVALPTFERETCRLVFF